jgi:hypothetical protein
MVEAKDGGREVYAGHGREPSSDGVNMKYGLGDFARGNAVLALWWGLWWPAKVVKVLMRDHTVKIKFDREEGVVEYQPRLLVPYLV